MEVAVNNEDEAEIVDKSVCWLTHPVVKVLLFNIFICFSMICSYKLDMKKFINQVKFQGTALYVFQATGRVN